MSRIRTFVAVSISPEVITNIQDLVRELSRGVEGVKWVDPEKLHFTLKFLGDVEDTELHQVCRAVADAAKDVTSFEIHIAGAGAFPSARRPRTVWAGVGRGEEEIIRLQKVVDRALRDLGFPRESRKFTPHVTLGRIRQGNPALPKLTQHLLEQAATEMGTSAVEEVLVFSSELRPEGPEYHVLGRAPLAP